MAAFDDVGEHLGVGVAGAGDGIHTGEGETANHGILERHNHYLSFAHRRERLCDCCLSFVVMGSVANLIGLPDRSRWLSERSCLGFVDQVDERAAVGATALAHGAQAVHSQTANHGILERHHVSFRWSKPWGFEFCLSASF